MIIRKLPATLILLWQVRGIQEEGIGDTDAHLFQAEQLPLF